MGRRDRLECGSAARIGCPTPGNRRKRRPVSLEDACEAKVTKRWLKPIEARTRGPAEAVPCYNAKATFFIGVGEALRQ